MAFLKYADAIYVGGEWEKTDQREAVINPADESLLIEAPVGSARQVDAAIGAARTAFDKGDWPHLPVAERQAVLTRFLDAHGAAPRARKSVGEGERGSDRVDT